MAGKTDYTNKGTKQRSLNLDDETYAIIEAEAARLHVTNSAALSMILHNFRHGFVSSGAAPNALVDPERMTQVGEKIAATQANERNIVLPDPRASEFTVSDPANAGKDGDPVKPGERKVRTRHLKDDDILGGEEQ
jgi:hypothetical protein